MLTLYKILYAWVHMLASLEGLACYTKMFLLVHLMQLFIHCKNRTVALTFFGHLSLTLSHFLGH